MSYNIILKIRHNDISNVTMDSIITCTRIPTAYRLPRQDMQLIAQCFGPEYFGQQKRLETLSQTTETYKWLTLEKLEDEFPFGMAHFQGRTLLDSGRLPNYFAKTSLDHSDLDSFWGRWMGFPVMKLWWMWICFWMPYVASSSKQRVFVWGEAAIHERLEHQPSESHQPAMVAICRDQRWWWSATRSNNF